MELSDFRSKLYKEIKKTYSTENKNLLNLSTVDFIIHLGYPENFIKNFQKEFNFAFPVIYPFSNLNLKNKKIINLGSGTCIDSLLAINNGASFVCSVDLSESFLKKSVYHHKNNKIVGNIEHLFFKKNSFDLGILNGTINLILDKKSLLEQINVILKKNALLIIGDLFWCGNLEERSIYRKDINSWCWCVGGCLTEEELFNMVNEVGFKIEEIVIYEQIDNLKRIKYILKNEK